MTVAISVSRDQIAAVAALLRNDKRHDLVNFDQSEAQSTAHNAVQFLETVDKV